MPGNAFLRGQLSGLLFLSLKSLEWRQWRGESHHILSFATIGSPLICGSNRALESQELLQMGSDGTFALVYLLGVISWSFPFFHLPQLLDTHGQHDEDGKRRTPQSFRREMGILRSKVSSGNAWVFLTPKT